MLEERDLELDKDKMQIQGGFFDKLDEEAAEKISLAIMG